MLLAPSRTKYRRQHRGRMKGAAQRGNTLAFGQFGLQALEPCWMEARQIEAARIALTRFMKRGGKVWIRVFPDKPITAKPAETRMGSGKGAVDHWVAVVKPGRIIFEIGGVSEEVAKEAVRLASHKLPVATRFITRGEAESVEA
jgi:large subunit ribosomal protein L16